MPKIKICAYSLMCVLLGLPTFQAIAEEESTTAEASVSSFQYFPRVSLAALVQRVSGSPRKLILISERVQAEIATGDIGNSSISYPVFLTILRNNELTAVVSDDVVSIIPEVLVRSHALRTAVSLEQDIPSNEWVNFIFRPQHASAPQMVPILRPLMPQSAHLAAFPEQNALIIVDRFENVKRIVGIVRLLDQPTANTE